MEEGAVEQRDAGAANNAVDPMGCKSPAVNRPTRTASISGARGGNESRDARMEKPWPHVARSDAVGTTWVATKPAGLNVKE